LTRVEGRTSPPDHERFGLLHEFFGATVARHPGRVAVEVPPGPGRPFRVRVTYQELSDAADSIAAKLAGLVGPDSVVVIILPRDSHWIYAAQLGVLRAGAAFTCLDPSFPARHVASVITDAEALVVLGDADGLGRVEASGVRIEHGIDVTRPGGASGRGGSGGSRVRSEHLAYVIYTSGTTGIPKGVMIEHRSVAHLVASDVDEFGLTSDDRVVQGSSAAYDSSIEETWLAFAVGATLVVMDDHTSRLGPDLVEWLGCERVTVFCPPPTLLRTTGCSDPAATLPELRLLYVGGEALTEDLASLWGTSRRMVNGYGPTECTVTVVRGDVGPGKPISIGKPVRGHRAFVMDDRMREVVAGMEGELCIVGPGVARGYRRRPEVTAAKFVDDPVRGRMYRTGDLVRENSAGDLEYLGRIDAQVKLRGYRVELEAVEACLSRCAGVREAACRVQRTAAGEILAAHVVLSSQSSSADVAGWKRELRGSLPAYMVPNRFGVMASLPRTVGGKIDRKSLPDVTEQDGGDADGGGSGVDEGYVSPTSDLERWVVSAFSSALKLGWPVSVEADFFHTLGGDSLSAVAAVCELRKRPETASITTRDLYEARTAARLARAAGARSCADVVLRRGVPDAAVERSPTLVTVLQLLWLAASLVVVSGAGYVVLFDVVPWLVRSLGVWWAAVISPVFAVLGLAAYTAASVMVAVTVKWVVIGRYRATVEPVWGEYFLRHWIVEQTARAVPWGLLEGTVAYGAVLRMLGARVGRRVHIHHGVDLHRGGWDLLTIGDDATLGCDSWVGLVELNGGCLHIAPVTIGTGATLEVRAGVSGNSVIEAGGVLSALSWLEAYGRIHAGERWDGVPARPAGRVREPDTPVPGLVMPAWLHGAAMIAASLLRQSLLGAGGVVLLIVMCGMIADATGLGFERAWDQMLSLGQDWSWLSGLSLAAVLAAPIAWLPFSLTMRALAVRVLGRVKPGVINRWSVGYIRVWLKTREVDSASRWLSGTLYWPMWLRLAGMRVGARCEISTVIDIVPECVSVGAESFFADGIYLGGPRVHRGTVNIGATTLGEGTFLGNHAVIPGGASLPDGSFLGVCTVAPETGMVPGSSWFGHPAMRLHRREVVEADRGETHEPSAIRVVSRVFWETLRFALPAVPIAAFLGWVWGIEKWSEGKGWLESLVFITPVVTAIALAAECVLVLALKWLLLGRMKPGRHPLWSCWCSRWDFLYVAWQYCALGPLSSLQGTLVLNLILRATGARVGRGVVLGPGFSQLVDPDMLRIDDGATVNANFQAHSFEDRVLKLAHVYIGRDSTVGENSVVFYGADVGQGAWVAPNSVVMKNEAVPQGLSVAGCPIVPVGVETTRATIADAENTELGAGVGEREKGLDMVRGAAVLGMVFAHFVPGGESVGNIESLPTYAASLLEGKPAALFCVLAGMTWELRLQRRAGSEWHWTSTVRRAFVLAVLGVLLHVLAWPTQVLVSLAGMMLTFAVVRRMGRAAVAWSLVMVLAATPTAYWALGVWFDVDLLDDGGHLADGGPGWSWLRYLFLTGHYSWLPWFAFPLAGSLLVSAGQAWRDIRRLRRGFVSAAIAAAVLQAAAVYSASVADGGVGVWADYLGFSWVPPTIPFVLLNGSFAVSAVFGVMWWLRSGGPAWTLRPLELIGRASLSHYVLHLVALYVPLRAVMGTEEWTAEIGVVAAAGYAVMAAAASVLWFRRFDRGPAEWAWWRAAK